MEIVTIDIINNELKNGNKCQTISKLNTKNICQIANHVYNSLSLEPMMNSDFDYMGLNSEEIIKIVYNYFEKLDPSFDLVKTIKYYIDGNCDINIFEPSSDKIRKTNIQIVKGTVFAEIYPQNDTSAFYTFAEAFINILNAKNSQMDNKLSLVQTQFIRDSLSDYLITQNIVNGVEGKKITIRNINYVRGMCSEVLMENYLNKYLTDNGSIDLEFIHNFSKAFGYTDEKSLNYIYSYIKENLNECFLNEEKMLDGNLLGVRLYEKYKINHGKAIYDLKQFILKGNNLSYEEGISTLGLNDSQGDDNQLEIFIKHYVDYAKNNLSTYTDSYIKDNRIFNNMRNRLLMK